MKQDVDPRGRRLAVIALCVALTPAVGNAGDATPQVRAGSTAPLQGFVENKGQWPDDVRFFAQAGSIELTVVDEALVLRRAPDPDTREWPAPLILRFPQPAKAVRGEGVLPTEHHFFLGERRASHVLGYERVVCEGIADGIDLVVRRESANFAYDLHVAAGASLEDFALEFEGATEPRLRADGSLTFMTAAGEVTQRIGKAWQVEADGTTTAMTAEFRQSAWRDDCTRIGFVTPTRDARRPFVLDPTLSFGTYVGGAQAEQFRNMTVDSTGAVYLLAFAATGMPTTPSAVQPTSAGIGDAWVGKLSPDGSWLLWATFVGGGVTDSPYGLDVDQDGTVVVVGDTWSNDFPTTPGVVQPTHGGMTTSKSDVFVTRLAPDGSALVWSTYYGGTNHEGTSASALFPSGDVLIAGEPYAADPPATPGAFDPVFDLGDRVLVRLSADGTHVVFQTYLQAPEIRDVRIDGQETIYLVGIAGPQAPVPTTPGVFQSTLLPGDTTSGFVARMAPLGDQLIWCTYLGGEKNTDALWALDVDAAGAVYVVGNSGGLAGPSNYPTTPGAYSDYYNGGSGPVVTKLLPNGTGLVWSTLIDACCGGSTSIPSLAVDTAGNVIVVGSSIELTYPVTPDAFQKSKPSPFANSDLILTKFDSFGERLVYSTWFGGVISGENFPVIDLVDGADPVIGLYISSQTGSADFPVTPGAYQTTYAGGGDLGVAKFDFALAPWTVLGGGVKGAKETPNLAGAGPLKAGTPGRLSLRGALPNANALLIAGVAELNAVVMEGKVVPSPQILVPFTTGVAGEVDIAFTWPAGVPAGVPAWVQVWVQDPGSGVGWSASNALRFVSQ